MSRILSPWYRSLCLVGTMAAVLIYLAPVLSATAKNKTGGAEPISRNPYLGAIVINDADGQELFAENADVKAYPASIVKLMGLLVVLEKVQKGETKLTDTIKVTAEAARMGGSQVYLKENETFSLDDLLYAMMVQSANDAVTAIAIHVAGSKDAFVEIMNDKAKELGLANTRFASVHGLPPEKGQEFDVSTPRDLAALARVLLKHPDVLRYTSTRERLFRNGTLVLRNHNHLLTSIDGCDGLKTGYFYLAGFSIVATAKRGEVRVIAVVMGSPSSQTRDVKARELLIQGLAKAQAIKAVEPLNIADAPPMPPARRTIPFWAKIALIAALTGIAGGLLGIFLYRDARKRRPK